jgi:hypothetical protein
MNEHSAESLTDHLGRDLNIVRRLDVTPPVDLAPPGRD